MNELLREIMLRDTVSKEHAIEMILEEFEEADMDPELALWNLGFEPDYCFDLLDICARS